MPKTEVSLKPSVETLEQRLDSMDRAIVLVQESVNRMPTPSLVMAAVDALKELTSAHLSGLRELVDAKFEGNKTALDAALKTQKEASDKIEANFTKQFESIGNIVEAKTKALDEKIGDNKDRITNSEGRSKGLGDGWVILVGAVGVIGIIASIVTAIIIRS